jgi:hypothetical protein
MLFRCYVASQRRVAIATVCDMNLHAQLLTSFYDHGFRSVRPGTGANGAIGSSAARCNDAWRASIDGGLTSAGDVRRRRTA